MKHSTFAAICAALSISSATAGPYAGLAIGNRSHQELPQAAGPALQPADRDSPLVAYGGYQLSENWAVEGGYGRMSDTRFTAAAGRAKAESSLAYLAGRWSAPLGESTSWYAKLGVARNALRVEGAGSIDGKEHALRPMGALGIAYHIAPRLALTGELASYGRVQSAGLRKSHTIVQAGLRFGF
ncbi:outer membrane beta-barrel protein [Massilia sp. ZL223]|uniref:outer membrane beta-barrel protein n=1 Tax=Massilia sp. ZL223 TaxID=2824904 RepID=UPI001B80EC76|nr:outer membrane beta-barrel protein [Massilia sp. ZL223]MBQ5962101.1 porin family protein [Massilia sp. ZL223]